MSYFIYYTSPDFAYHRPSTPFNTVHLPYILYIFEFSLVVYRCHSNYGGAGRANTSSQYTRDLTHDCLQTGAKALAGTPEYINVKIFDAVDYDRKVTGSGKSIMCYDPNIDDTSSSLWAYQNTSITDETAPAGSKVRVIGATVKFTKSST